jgi:MFS family permease
MQDQEKNPYSAPQTPIVVSKISPVEYLPPLPGGWTVVALLWVVALLNYLDRNMVMTMHDSIVNQFKIDDKQFGLVTTVFLVSYGVFSPIGGFLADRYSKRVVIVFSLFVWSAVTWWTGHVNSFAELLVARAFMGISEACYIPAGLALIADYHRGGTRSLATGLHMSGINLGGALGGVGGVLSDHYSWNTPFVIFGVGGIVYAVFLLLTLRNAPVAVMSATEYAARPKVNFFDAVTRLFKNKSYLTLLLFWALLGFAGWALNKWMPTYLKETFNLSQGKSGMLALGFLQGSSMVGVIIGGFLSDRMSKTNPRGRIIVPVVGLIIAAASVFLSANSGVLSFVLLGLAGYGLARIFSDANVMPILCEVADTRYRATGYGILNMFSCFVGGLSVYLGGVLRDANVNPSLIFNCSAGVILLCAFIISLVKFAPKGQETTV